MKIACGTDIIEIDRIKQSIDEMGSRFIERIYTNKEIEYCESKKFQKYQHYAVRFAGKEATLKAISSKLENKYNMEWKDIEITNDEQGRPHVSVLKEIEGLEQLDISMSHCKQYATANVIATFV